MHRHLQHLRDCSTIAVLAVSMLTVSGCKSASNVGNSNGKTSTSAPATTQSSQDVARITQLRNIVANRGIRAVPEAVHQLAESKAEGAFEAISSGLMDESLMVRMYCATALGTLGDERAVPLLRKALRSRYTGLRLAAVVGIGRLGAMGRPAVAELGAMLKQEFQPMHPSVQHIHLDDDVHSTRTITMRIHLAALRALGQIGGGEAQGILADVLNMAVNTEIEWTGARALKAMGARDALMSAGIKGKASAWRMLAEMKHVEALPEMLKQVTDTTIPEARRSQIAYALGVLQDRRATPMLLDMLRGKSGTLCKAAAWSLNMMADPQSLQGLLDYVQIAPDKAPGLYSAVCAIGAIEGPDALAALRQLASHPSSSVREAVAYRLDERATAEDLPVLIALVSNPQPGGHFPIKALSRLLPASIEPLTELLPIAKPELQANIAAVLVKHETGRPVVREMLTSSNDMVRSTARRLLWEQRDPAVPISWFFEKNEFPPTGLDERDVPALKQLTPTSGDAQYCPILTVRFNLAPKDAWPLIRPLFFTQDTPAIMRAYNSMRGNWPEWVSAEMLRAIDDPTLSAQGKATVLELLEEHDCISEEAVGVYRRCADDPSYQVRIRAYECLWNEASDASMAFLSKKALDGDEWARFCIGRSPDKRLAATFARLVDEAIKKKETWVGGYVHCWPTVSGVAEYVSKVGSNYADQWKAAQQTISETVPD